MHAVMQYSPQIESTWLNLTAWKSDLDVIESDVYQHKCIMSEVDPRTERVKYL